MGFNLRKRQWTIVGLGLGVYRLLKHVMHVPIGFPAGVKTKNRIITMVTVFPPLFILVFKPFRLDDFAGTTGIWVYVVIASFGLMSGLLTFFYIYPLAAWLGIDANNYTVWMAFCYYGSFFVLLGASNYLFTWSLEGWQGFSWQGLYVVTLRTYLIGLIPLSLVVSWTVGQQYLRNASDKVVASRSIGQGQYVTLVTEMHHERLRIRLDRLLYIVSEGNYCEAFVLGEAGSIEKSLLRCTLLSLENQLKGTTMFRCHRSYLVNLQRVTRMTGNSRGMQLQLEVTEASIPVSRAKIDALKGAIG